MNTAPRGLRIHIAVFGRTNAGKSSLINALTGQQVSIVSPLPGTTTDPVEKPLEIFPIGPCVLIDTAGLGDVTALGEAREARTLRVLEKTDLAVLVLGGEAWSDHDEALLTTCAERKLPVVVVANQQDRVPMHPTAVTALAARNLTAIATSAVTGAGIEDLRQAIIAKAPESLIAAPVICSDLVQPGGVVVLVVPIDKEAPKGRLILPQVQTIRDLLDGDAMSLVVKERELPEALARLRGDPDLVVTDSQAFLKVVADVPERVPVTSFSILMARAKGDLDTFAAGAAAIDDLKSGDRVLIAESCTHHAISDDIGTVKIPRWLRQYVGVDLKIEHAAGNDFPADLADFRLVIHCGACTTNRRQVLSRIARCRAAGVPITNYGIAIAATQGILDRVLVPFPSALEAYRSRLLTNA